MAYLPPSPQALVVVVVLTATVMLESYILEEKKHNLKLMKVAFIMTFMRDNVLQKNDGINLLCSKHHQWQNEMKGEARV